MRTVGNPIIASIDLVSLIIGGYGVYAIVSLPLPSHLEAAGHWQFLTNLSLLYSLVVFALGFVAHVSRNRTLYHIKNTIHPVGLVLESIVAGVYWPLRLFFLHLLAKDPSKFQLPLRVDLAIHLMPVTSLLVDYLVYMPRWTITTPAALTAVVGLTGAYWFHLKRLVDLETGAEYPYAFLNVENDTQRAVIFGTIGLVSFVQFLVLKKSYDVIVRNETKKNV